jgi:heat-inducible transcriptional repressor
MSLLPRQKNVLRWVVKTYIENAAPVGSSQLVKKYRLNYSPATIRNEMACLEGLGYIAQPHTSAGRIPTDEGYRYYVGGLVKQKRLTADERLRIRDEMQTARGNVSQLLEQASRILGKHSNELAVVLTPWLAWGILDRLEFIELTGNKILIVIHVKNRLVKTFILECDSDFKQKDLERLASALNERLSGLTLEEVKNSIKSRVKNLSGVHPVLLRRIIESSRDLFDFAEPVEVYTCGTQNILGQPEFSDTKLLEVILQLLDNRKRLIDLFHRKVDDPELCIGSENEDSSLKAFTVIRASYSRGKDTGTLGIVGPTRMRYSRIIPLIDTLAQTMSECLS